MNRKMKSWKRLIALLLVVLLVMSMTQVATAENSTDELELQNEQGFNYQQYENYSKGDLTLDELESFVMDEENRPGDIKPDEAENSTDELKPQNEQEFIYHPYDNYGKGDLALDELESLVLDEDDRPEAISTAEMEEGGHVHRLREQEEDLNTVVFQNTDGSKTMYYFADPVKYEDADGTINDKSNDLSDLIDKDEYCDDYAYVNADNDIRTYFPDSLDEDSGVILEYNEINIEMYPSNRSPYSYAESNAPTKVEVSNEMDSFDDAIEYEDVFGDSSTLRYTPLFNGFKEDIIIESFNGISEYDFTIKTNGLRFVSEYDQYYLADPETNDIVALVGELIVFDSSESMEEKLAYNHKYSVKTVVENDEYLLTIVLDESFLLNSDTVYPVTVDPTITINNSSSGILDIDVKSTGAVTRNTSLLVGRSSSDKLVHRSFLKFPGVENHQLYDSLAPFGFGGGVYPEITNMTLRLQNAAIGVASANVNAYYNTGLNWTANTISMTGTQFNATGSQITSLSIGTNSTMNSFNLTNIAGKDITKGIILKNTYEGTNDSPVNKSFYSTRSSYSPSLVVTFTNPSGGAGFSTAETLSLNNTRETSVFSANEKRYFKFTPSSTGFYTFESSSPISPADPKAWLYNSSQVELTSDDDSAGNRNFRISYHLDAGQTYYLAAGCYSTVIGTYSLKVTANKIGRAHV